MSPLPRWTEGQAGVCSRCRPNGVLPCGPPTRAALCPHPSFRRQGIGRPTSIQDFGHPVDASAGACAVMDMRDLPSIKKTQEAIQTEVAAFKKGPGMHDSGGEKSDVFK